MKKKFLVGGFLTGLLSVLGLRKKLKSLAPKIPQVDDHTVVLFQFEYSPFCAKIRYILDFKNIPYKVVNLPPLGYQHFNRQLSGQTKVPYIIHQNQIITDSTDIALYLEKIKPEPSILPEDPVFREKVLLLEDYLDEVVQPSIGKLIYVTNYKNPEKLIADPTLTTGFKIIDNNKKTIIPLVLKSVLRKRKLSLNDEPDLLKRLQEVLERIQHLVDDKVFLLTDQPTLADFALISYLDSAERRLPNIFSTGNYEDIISWRENFKVEINLVNK